MVVEIRWLWRFGRFQTLISPFGVLDSLCNSFLKGSVGRLFHAESIDIGFDWIVSRFWIDFVDLSSIGHQFQVVTFKVSHLPR